MTHLLRNGLLFSLFILPLFAVAQQTNRLTQTIRGVVKDKTTGGPVTGATIILDDTDLAAITDSLGAFRLQDVAIGRHSVTVSFVGYEPAVIKEILVTSAREVYLEVAVEQKAVELEEVIVRPGINKAGSLNRMAVVGAKMFSTEEAARFAGGMDDPARLVSAYAGITPPAGSGNGISIHGNAPSLLQWRVEGVEAPNPNHFADMNGLGGGLLSALSSNVLGNSDFFTGAFPAEYHNAISGVFDMKMRNGNDQKYQHTFQLGVLGIDFASEGPVSRKNKSSYLFNYRYSTTGLLEKIRKGNMGGTLNYQDLNFKFNFPTTHAGTFSLWGTGWSDEVDPTLDDPSEWKYKDDAVGSAATQKAGATGISHRYYFKNSKTSVNSILAATYSSNKVNETFHENDQTFPRMLMKGNTNNYILTSALDHKFSARHSNRTGVTVTNINYDMNFDYATYLGQALQRVVDAGGNANLIAAHSASLFRLGNTFTLTAGVNGQYFTLNSNGAIEPRLGLKWQASPKSSFAAGYGLHSRMEKPDVYFVRDNNGNLPNKDLNFIKSHHFMLSYAYRFSGDMNLRIEPYFKPLYNVPVTADGSFSILNRDDFYITQALVNKGKGRNYGVDVTFERYLVRGLYYMFTGSLFESEYMAADGNWYNTRYNRNFILNALGGKEWMLGRNMFSVNLKTTLMGGQRYTPVNETATLAHPDKEVQYDQSRMYSQQFSPVFLANFTIAYKMNREKVAHEFAVKGVNATNAEEYTQHKYNVQTGVIEPYKRANSLFNVSYKIEF